MSDHLCPVRLGLMLLAEAASFVGEEKLTQATELASHENVGSIYIMVTGNDLLQTHK